MIIYPDEIVKLLDRTVAILKGNCVGDFKVGDIVIIKDKKYKVIGIEGGQAFPFKIKGVGLNIKEI